MESGDSRVRRLKTALQGEWRQPCKGSEDCRSSSVETAVQGEWRQSCKETGDSRARRVETAVQGGWRQPCKENGDSRAKRVEGRRKYIKLIIRGRLLRSPSCQKYREIRGKEHVSHVRHNKYMCTCRESESFVD